MADAASDRLWHLTFEIYWGAGSSSPFGRTEHEVQKMKQTALGHKVKLWASSLCTLF